MCSPVRPSVRPSAHRYRVLSGRECATDVFCPAAAGDGDDGDGGGGGEEGGDGVSPQERIDWIGFLEALREADVPE